MFSGITNQFTSLVGAVKGGGPDEDVPAPSQEATAAEAAATAEHEANVAAAAAAAAAAGGGEPSIEGEEGAKRSSTLVDSLLTEATGWLGSAKGWLGSASASIPSMPAMPSMPSMPAMPSIPSIPGLRKTGGDAGDGSADGAAQQGDGAVGAATGIDDDDKSRYISATEGADSHPASGGGTPTGDEGQIGQGKGDDVKITTKVTQQAKHFGSFLSSAINKAGAKIKETVKENPILESFNKEQEAFIKGQSGSADGIAPWIGHANEAKIKEEILGLSQDRRNFVRAPPAGVDFDFNYDTAYPTAIAIMAEDKALEQMRFELVPKIITEENFWRNYFYRVSLIIQAAELGTLGADGVGQASSGEDAKQDLPLILKQNKDDQLVAENLTSNIDKNLENATLKNMNTTATKKDDKISESEEFVSDAFQSTSEKDLEEIKNGMRILGIDSMTQQALSSNDEEQWEKDLEAELKDYEVVSDTIATTSNRSRNSNNSSKRGKRNSKKTSGSSSSVDALNDNNDDDELPTISNLRTRSTTNNDWEEEYADLIEDTDDLK